MDNKQAITAIYLGSLNRNPDQEGFKFWFDKVTSGESSILDVAAAVANSQESLQRYPEYPYTTNVGTFSTVLKNSYEGLFNRTYELNGLQYWLTKVQDGLAPDKVVPYIAESAIAEDAQILHAKIDNFLSTVDFV